MNATVKRSGGAGLLTLPQAAAALRISLDKLRALARKPPLRDLLVPVNRNARLIRTEDLDEVRRLVGAA